MNAAAQSLPTLYLTELDVTRLEGIASRNGTALMADMLDTLLERAAIVPAEDIPTDVITMNSSVLCKLQGETDARRLTLVYPDNADFDAGRLSVLSPVGQALLGARIGQTVGYALPNGRQQQIEVIDLAFQPEANGDFTR
jgi:regulator of nucleoside diphosphate kinase